MRRDALPAKTVDDAPASVVDAMQGRFALGSYSR
jgi:hypothetical protein